MFMFNDQGDDNEEQNIFEFFQMIENKNQSQKFHEFEHIRNMINNSWAEPLIEKCGKSIKIFYKVY